MTRFCIVLLIGLLCVQCTTSRWVVQDEREVISDEVTLLNQETLILAKNSSTEGNPLITFELYKVETNEREQGVIVRRYLQDYRPQWGFMLTGLGAAALMIYAANFADINQTGASANYPKYLNIAAAITATVAVLNMKAVGEPKETGETRMLKKAGKVITIDTTYVDQIGAGDRASITVHYKDQTILKDFRTRFIGGKIDFSLSQRLELGTVKDVDPGYLWIELEYNNRTHEFVVPLNEYMRRYAQVTQSQTPLRSAPVTNRANIITELQANSRLQLVDSTSTWYRVLYGISSTYIAKENSMLVWNLPVSDRNLVMVSGDLELGEIDIEQNIPVHPNAKHDGIAILAGVSSYQDNQFVANRYVSRDLKVLKQYMVSTLGYEEENVFLYENITSHELRQLLGDAKDSGSLQELFAKRRRELLFYFIGNSGVIDVRNAILMPSDYQQDRVSTTAIGYNYLSDRLSQLITERVMMFFDTSFIFYQTQNRRQISSDGIPSSAMEVQLSSVLRNKTEAFALFSSQPGQMSNDFESRDGRVNNRHTIFTYYFCRGLKQGLHQTRNLLSYLEKDVSFTSRRYFDQPQAPFLIGNPQVNIVITKP